MDPIPESLFEDIAAIDHRIASLIQERATKLVEMGRLDSSASVAAALQQQLNHLSDVCNATPGAVPEGVLRAVFREIYSGTSQLVEPVTVAYLGPQATFTHQAALSRFGTTAVYMPQKTIGDVFDAVRRGRVLFGVVPVENSTEGAVTHTLDMFVDSEVSICAEIVMAIHHNLLCNGPTDELTTVFSHPQVFGQCRGWLQENLRHVSLVEMSSTTEAAMRCAREPGTGALASRLAADQFNLAVKAEDIEDCTHNTTRFFVLGSERSSSTGDDKTSLVFAVRDRVGALYDCLRAFSRNNVNLTMIESRPSRRRSWEYVFFVDVSGHMEDPGMAAAMENLQRHCQFVRIIGSYPRATSVV